MTWVCGVGRCVGGQRMKWEGWVRLGTGGMRFVLINIIIKALGRIFKDPRYYDSYMFFITKNLGSPKSDPESPWIPLESPLESPGIPPEILLGKPYKTHARKHFDVFSQTQCWQTWLSASLLEAISMSHLHELL